MSDSFTSEINGYVLDRVTTSFYLFYVAVNVCADLGLNKVAVATVFGLICGSLFDDLLLMFSLRKFTSFY